MSEDRRYCKYGGCNCCEELPLAHDREQALERERDRLCMIVSQEAQRRVAAEADLVRLREEAMALRELSKAQDDMLTIYRSGNYHRAGPAGDRIETARAEIQRLQGRTGGRGR